MRFEGEQRTRPLRAGLAWGGAALASVAAFALVPALQFALQRDLNTALHTLLETVSIVVSALVFSVGAVRLVRGQGGSIAVVSFGFLAVALLDFLHVLSFDGMPAFLTPSGGGKAISFFLAARLIGGAAMIAIAWVSWRRAPDRWRRVFAGVTLLLAATLGVIGFLPGVKELFFEPGRGLTALKVGAEYTIVGSYLLAAAGFAWRARTPQPFPVGLFFTASVLMAVSEFCFTLYARTNDQFSNLGHVWKVIAYLFVYRAVLIYAIQRPYRQLHTAQREIMRLNRTLEQRVHQRTALLEAANRDLEAFSYSVAHDLRAPLSAIDGFSTALAEQAQGELGPRASHYLQRIRTNSQNMSEMIDALLELSRVSRATVDPKSVDLADIADGVLENLRRAEPQRQVEVQLQRPLPARGDPTLLRTALQNLIGNAWKFSARRTPARLELGMLEEAGEAVYFVRDNGEGFDMAFAGRLFQLFQRIHTDSSFAGHGIGLVNVQRIVHLHGGRIWVDAAPGTGATFYFTLAAAPQAETETLQPQAASL